MSTQGSERVSGQEGQMTVHKALRHEFGMGFTAGIRETLNQIEGRSTIAPEGCYRGPVPDELLHWIASARKRLDGLSS